ncbi:LemA family protein [Undibacterium sp. Ren11W]|uniref:LemA family protein n=1 Tax=Undibacterium sp. Ren11W TaxID=3413045 RepID=UPI003BF21600
MNDKQHTKQIKTQTMTDLFSKTNETPHLPGYGEQKPRSGKWLLGILTLIFVLITLCAWYSMNQYNYLQDNDERVDAEWSHVLNQYTRRADLIPNLVAVVKSYASHETTLFNEIAAARSKVTELSSSAQNSTDPRALGQFLEAQKQLAVPLSRLLMVAEKYPDLKASDLYRDLMVQLEGTENRITYSRQRYIEAVASYNFMVRRFPSNLIAKQAGYTARAKFDVENASAIQHPPEIELK